MSVGCAGDLDVCYIIPRDACNRQQPRPLLAEISSGQVLCWSELGNTFLINPRRACAARVTVLCVSVCLCVCVCVTQHLTFYVFIRATNDTNLLGVG